MLPLLGADRERGPGREGREGQGEGKQGREEVQRPRGGDPDRGPPAPRGCRR